VFPDEAFRDGAWGSGEESFRGSAEEFFRGNAEEMRVEGSLDEV
jgi:hypothetical protein